MKVQGPRLLPELLSMGSKQRSLLLEVQFWQLSILVDRLSSVIVHLLCMSLPIIHLILITCMTILHRHKMVIENFS